MSLSGEATIILRMRVVTGRVEGGKIVVEGEPLEEGSTVTVLAPEANEAFELGEKEEAALLRAIEEADRGDVVTAEAFFRNLPPRG
ncbi:MAG: hypothetical protein L0Y66_06705 [Myxococcaceae bacterium]|nr:hypothetical protein [Myxococcaceae bacterium]MCI0669579.1 hypothetical protein [Myxococcaceae bacterium]